MSESRVKQIILRYKDEDRVIDQAMWKRNPLPRQLAGEARVIVKRGGIVANIPQDVPFGTFCLCVNLASIKTDAVPPERITEVAQTASAEARTSKAKR